MTLQKNRIKQGMKLENNQEQCVYMVFGVALA